MSYDRIKDYVVMSITVYILIIASLPDFINPLDFDVNPAKNMSIPLYGTLTVFLVLFYLTCDDKYLSKYSRKMYDLESISDTLLRFNLFFISLLLLFVIYSHSFTFNIFISRVYLILLVLIILTTLFIPVILLVFSTVFPIILFFISKCRNLTTPLEILRISENNQQAVIQNLKNKIKILKERLQIKD